MNITNLYNFKVISFVFMATKHEKTNGSPKKKKKKTQRINDLKSIIEN